MADGQALPHTHPTEKSGQEQAENAINSREIISEL